MPAGRPTKYTDEILANAKNYVDSFSELGEQVPTVAGLSLAIGVSRDTIYAWDDNEDLSEFSDTLERLRALQQMTLINKGLDGSHNPTIAKMLLSANHGMHEKSQSEHTGPKGGPLQIQEIQRTIVDPA